jgi:hypothetical protein
MTNFTEVASRFFRLALDKKFKNGCNLNSAILFDAICHLPSDEMTVENANKKLFEMYGFKFNSATLSRNNTTLMELGLIKLVESSDDRRYKEIKLVAPKGVQVKKLMYSDGERVWKYK